MVKLKDMRNKMKTLISAVALLIFVSSCSSLKVAPDYLMDEASLNESINSNEKSLVLFWTDWCPASESRINNLYIPLAEQVKEQGLDLNIILLASDSNISAEEVDRLRGLGITCYYIDKPGGFAIANRMAIKKYINNAFPENEIARIKGPLYGIPVELLINKDGEIVNETETSKSYDYIQQILKPVEE